MHDSLTYVGIEHSKGCLYKMMHVSASSWSRALLCLF